MSIAWPFTYFADEGVPPYDVTIVKFCNAKSTAVKNITTQSNGKSRNRKMTHLCHALLWHTYWHIKIQESTNTVAKIILNKESNFI